MKAVVGGKPSRDTQTQFKRDENGLLDETGRFADPTKVLHVKFPKEARFLVGVGVINRGGTVINGVLHGGIDEGKTARLFDYSEKIVVTIKVHDTHRLTQINHIRKQGDEKIWITEVDNGSPADQNFLSDAVEKLNGVGKQTKLFLTKLNIHVLSDVVSKIPDTEAKIQAMLQQLIPEQKCIPTRHLLENCSCCAMNVWPLLLGNADQY